MNVLKRILCLLLALMLCAVCVLAEDEREEAGAQEEAGTQEPTASREEPPEEVPQGPAGEGPASPGGPDTETGSPENTENETGGETPGGTEDGGTENADREDGDGGPEESDPPYTGSVLIRVDPAAGVETADGAYRAVSDANTELIFSWRCTGECDAYRVQVIRQTAEREETVLERTQTTAEYRLNIAGLSKGSYLFRVQALINASPVAESLYPFGIASRQDAPAEGGPGENDPGENDPAGNIPGEGDPSENDPAENVPGEDGPEGDDPGEDIPGEDIPGEDEPGEDRPGGGRRPGGSFFGGWRGFGGSGEEQGFRVTPGKALTSGHAYGDRDMRLYGTLALNVPDGEMDRLVMDGEELAVVLDGGEGRFTASVDDGTLTLSAAGDPRAWTINGAALKTLSRSGIDTVRLVFGDSEMSLPAETEMTGREYARLRAGGYVSGDYDFIVTRGAVAVMVDGNEYRIGNGNELVPVKG